MTRMACLPLVMCLLALGGCFGHNTIETERGAIQGFANPNSPPVPQAMATALQWAAMRYPPGMDRTEVGAGADRPRIAVSFPLDTRRDTANYVCTNTGPFAEPLTQENASLPTYHIARVWTRGLYATVDIFRPASQLGPAPGETTLYQCITVELRSGIGSYSVYSHKVWPVGVFDVPPQRYLAPGYDGRVEPAPGEQSTLPRLPDERPSTQPAKPAGDDARPAGQPPAEEIPLG